MGSSENWVPILVPLKISKSFRIYPKGGHNFENISYGVARTIITCNKFRCRIKGLGI